MSALNKLGEFGLIDRIHARRKACPSRALVGIGDDAAVVRPSSGAVMVLTTDTFVEGIDFDLSFSSWEQIGWKSMAANMSDIAAMGAAPVYALVSLCLSERRQINDVDDLYNGMDALFSLSHADVAIVGGDMSGTAGPEMISITLIGEMEPERVLLRSGARPGDTLCMTGHVGASEAGLRVLQHVRRQPERASWLQRFSRTIEKHRAPVPRVREGMLLARSGQVRAMIDISDGLSSDALHIARASRTGVRIDAYCIPIEEETRAAARALKENSVHLALRSGEEFELLCAVDPSGVDSLSRLLKAETGTTLTPVGMITPASEGCHWSDGKETHVLSPSGFDHFKTDGKNS